MRDLTTFFEIVFQNARISFKNLRKFAEITIQRIAMNNPGGIYTTILTDLTNGYTSYFGDLTDEETKKALREGSTLTMNISMDAFIAWVRQKEGIITGTFGIGSATHLEFYPNGMNEFTKMNLGNAEVLMGRYINVATLRQAELPAGFVADVTALRDTFVSARTLQNQLTGQVATERQEKYGTRAAVELQLMKCVLFIAFNNVGNIAACDTYFDQSFLKPSKPKIFEGTLAGNETKNLYEHEFDAEDEITAENTGTTSWKICLADAAGTSCSAGVDVAPGQTVTLTADKFGDVVNNHFLNVTNLDGVHAGSYKVTV